MVIFMTSYLAYSYSANLTKKERDEIDLRTKKSRKEFIRGFSTGITISVSAAAVYSAYSLFASKAAYALEPIVKSDSPVPDGTPAQVAPTPAQVAPAPARPGFKPLSDGSRGALVGAISTICSTAAQNGDFLLGLTFAGLCVVGGIIINRPHPPK